MQDVSARRPKGLRTKLIAVAILWVVAFLGASPMFSQNAVKTSYSDVSCGLEPTGIHSYIAGGLYLLFFDLVPLSVTIYSTPCHHLLLHKVGCGINNRTSSIIGRPISTVTLSLRSICGTLIGQRYLRGYTALDPDRPFR